MELAVDQVLAERSRRGRGPAVASIVGALGLHAAVVAALVVLPRLSPPPPPLDYVDVKVVPAAALGAPRREPQEKPPPAPQAPPAPPTPAPEEPPKPPAPAAPVLPVAPLLPEKRPDPPKPEKPKPEKPKPPVPDNRVDPTTQPKLLTPPRELLAQRLATAKPPARPAAPAPEAQALPNRPGSTAGSPTGTAPLGTSVATLDNPDFTYDYYISQLLSSIDHNWTRPPVGTGVRAIISFRILRDGGIADLAVRESSSFDNFDLAALRAVQNAAPFPPLPRAYRRDSLGVNLIVR